MLEEHGVGLHKHQDKEQDEAKDHDDALEVVVELEATGKGAVDHDGADDVDEVEVVGSGVHMHAHPSSSVRV